MNNRHEATVGCDRWTGHSYLEHTTDRQFKPSVKNCKIALNLVKFRQFSIKLSISHKIPKKCHVALKILQLQPWWRTKWKKKCAVCLLIFYLHHTIHHSLPRSTCLPNCYHLYLHREITHTHMQIHFTLTHLQELIYIVNFSWKIRQGVEDLGRVLQFQQLFLLLRKLR